jgi:hypothetical protein
VSPFRRVLDVKLSSRVIKDKASQARSFSHSDFEQRKRRTLRSKLTRWLLLKRKASYENIGLLEERLNAIDVEGRVNSFEYRRPVNDQIAIRGHRLPNREID